MIYSKSQNNRIENSRGPKGPKEQADTKHQRCKSAMANTAESLKDEEEEHHPDNNLDLNLLIKQINFLKE
tara:strand:+ start:534 stop:743 length:210 start_codon:yes stop_codon:yes gene_type:complete